MIQAGASAILMTNGATLIHEAFPAVRLSKAMGLYTASFSVASLVGPTVGGLVAQVGGWRWVFWFNLPVAIVGLAWGFLKLSGRERATKRPSLDASGNALLIIILVAAVYAISLVSDRGWSDPSVIIAALIAIGMSPVLIAAERRAANPVLSSAILRSNGAGSIYLAGFLNGAARFPVVVVIGLYFQVVLGEPASVAGALLLPVPIGMILTASMLGQFSKRLPPRPLATIGSAVGLVGMIGVLAAMMMHNQLLMGVALFLTGTGTGVFMGSNTTALLIALPEKSIGVGNAVRLMVSNVGNLLSVAVALAAITGAVPAQLRDSVLSASAESLSPETEPLLAVGFLISASVLVALSAASVLVCIQGQRSFARLK